MHLISLASLRQKEKWSWLALLYCCFPFDFIQPRINEINVADFMNQTSSNESNWRQLNIITVQRQLKFICCQNEWKLAAIEISLAAIPLYCCLLAEFVCFTPPAKQSNSQCSLRFALIAFFGHAASLTEFINPLSRQNGADEFSVAAKTND